MAKRATAALEAAEDAENRLAILRAQLIIANSQRDDLQRDAVALQEEIVEKGCTFLDRP